MKEALRKLLVYLEVLWLLSTRNAPPILVYQMGKVGSATIMRSLYHIGLRNPIWQVHFLSSDLDDYIAEHRVSGLKELPRHLLISKALNRRIASYGGNIKIITLVRDPIAFVISDVFQNPNFAGPAIRDNDGLIDSQRVSAYIQQELDQGGALDYVFNWFDKEIRPVFGFDLLAQEFSAETGYAIYQHRNNHILLMRTEKMDAVGPKALQEFLGLESEPELLSANVRETTADSRTYRNLISSIKIDPDICRKIYRSRFCQHFFTERELEELFSRWSNRSGSLFYQ